MSNLPFVSKILEKVVDTRIEHHVVSNCLHEPLQYAYRKFHSSETALLKVNNDIWTLWIRVVCLCLSCSTCPQHLTSLITKPYWNDLVYLECGWRIRRYLSNDATKSLVHGLVMSRLDYCNALIHGLPDTMISKLQCVQNTAARIVTRTARHNHIRDLSKNFKSTLFSSSL